jgi:uncharacterized protein YndB with AHSA1/START domain
MATRIKIRRTVQAERGRVFSALTDAGRLREWLCDWAWTDSRAGGHYILRWNTGYEARGSWVEVDPPAGLTLVWQGTGEPGPTLVRWRLQETGAGTAVTLEHSGFGSGPRWGPSYAEAKEGWTAALENLQSTLQEGVDLREVRRPFLGVLLDTLSAERVKNENIATTTGIYITGVVPEGAAEAAGIQSGDVIVGIGRWEVSDFNSLAGALQASRAGDTVAVELVRGRKRLTVQATLRGREQAEVPADLAAAVAQLRERQAQWNGKLAEATTSLNEEEAGRAPAEGEWSVKQVLAHLSGSERSLQERIALTVAGHWLEGNPDPALFLDRNAAVLAIEPTLAGLLARFSRDMEETALLLEHFSEAARADRYRCRQVARLVLDYFGGHTEGHITQVQETVAAVRGQAGG